MKKLLLALALNQAIRPAAIADIAGLPTQKPGGIERAPTTPIYTCPNCQRPNKPDTYFCTRCGAFLNQCPKCKNQNKARDRFCTRCGQPAMRAGTANMTTAEGRGAEPAGT